MPALSLQLYKKKTLAQLFSCEFFKISKNTFSYRTPLVVVSLSWSLIMHWFISLIFNFNLNRLGQFKICLLQLKNLPITKGTFREKSKKLKKWVFYVFCVDCSRIFRVKTLGIFLLNEQKQIFVPKAYLGWLLYCFNMTMALSN